MFIYIYDILIVIDWHMTFVEQGKQDSDIESLIIIISAVIGGDYRWDVLLWEHSICWVYVVWAKDEKHNKCSGWTYQ